MSTKYITTSIPYVNADPHIGYALECVQADFLARYYRSLGDTVRLQYGTDDNSLKNVRAAQAAGEATDAYVARHAENFKVLKEILNVTFDDFVRTREERHMRGAQKLWSAMNPADLYQKSYEGLYCVGCEAFYDATELGEGNVCPIHKKPVEVVKETNWFFKLSNYQEKIERLIAEDVIKIHPELRKNEILAFVKRGLEDFSISRSVERAENWGVPVPNDPSQVMYVWVDALSNYITALGYADDAVTFADFWQRADLRLHVIGKDIVRFHAVYWPAFLLSAGVQLPHEIFVHGFLTLDGQKISKSIGNVIAPEDFVKDFGADAGRFILLSAMPIDGDGDLSTAFFEATYTKLANGLGNLAGRVAAMANKYFDGAVDRVAYAREAEFRAELAAYIEARDFKRYIEHVWTVVDAANAKIQAEEPFKVVKTDPAAAKKTLSEIAAMVRVLADVLSPVMPVAMEELGRRFAGDTLVHGEPLFPRRDETAG